MKYPSFLSAYELFPLPYTWHENSTAAAVQLQGHSAPNITSTEIWCQLHVQQCPQTEKKLNAIATLVCSQGFPIKCILVDKHVLMQILTALPRMMASL